MRIQCNCGKFQAELTKFPEATPGRLMCYCDDCQAYLKHLGRKELLDPAGGTEIVPAYPCDVRIIQGSNVVQCTRLSDKGMYRFSTTCCNSPIGNTMPGSPWLGIHKNMYTVHDPKLLEKALGEIRGRIMGKFATGPTPEGTPDKFDFKGLLVVGPFMLKGAIGRKGKGSPFFGSDGKTPLVQPRVLSAAERAKL